MESRKFRLKEAGANPPVMQPPALESGIAGGSGRKFALQKKFAEVRNIRRGEERKAYLDDQGRLRIPLDADDKYRWWAGGQSVLATLLELGASDREIEAHIGPISTPESWRQWQRIKTDRLAGDKKTPA